jgi:elongation factor P
MFSKLINKSGVPVIQHSLRYNVINEFAIKSSSSINFNGLNRIGSIRGLKERAGKSVKPGSTLVIDNIPHRVTKITQGKRGKGGGYVSAKMKNMVTQNNTEKTFTSDETVEHADLEREAVQYSWLDGDNFVFISTVSFEEIRIPKDDVDNSEFIKEGQEVKLLKFRDTIIGVELPKIVEYSVISLDGSKSWYETYNIYYYYYYYIKLIYNIIIIRGGNIPATLDCGAVVMVPQFIKEGTVIRVNIADKGYVDRAS